MLTTKERSKIGKKSKQQGNRFELKVRKDLEEKGWIVAKWTNNIEFMCTHKEHCCARLVKVKNKFRGMGIPMMLGAGFPDFIAFKLIIRGESTRIGFDIVGENLYEVIGVESKMKGYLDKQEKEKIEWLRSNNIFSKVIIASKDKNKRGGIIYT